MCDTLADAGKTVFAESGRGGIEEKKEAANLEFDFGIDWFERRRGVVFWGVS